MRAKTLGSSPGGKYSAGGVKPTMMAALTTRVMAITAMRREVVAINQLITDKSHCIPGADEFAFDTEPRGSSRSAKFAAAVGTTVIATSIDTRIVADTPIAMSP